MAQVWAELPVVCAVDEDVGGVSHMVQMWRHCWIHGREGQLWKPC